MASDRAPSPSRCAVTRGEVDLSAYSKVDGEWKALGLAAPARRALVNGGCTRLEHLVSLCRRDVAALHGMGPNALAKLDEALKAAGLAFMPE
mgnify:FL=1